MSIRVILVDDHKIMRDGLKNMLNQESDIEVVAEASEGRTALRLAREMSPNVVVMDVAMPDLNGIEATRQITAYSPGIKVIALSMYADRRFVQGMLEAGASGYLLKDCAFEELVQAIREVIANRTYLSSAIIGATGKDNQSSSTKAIPVSATLSSREREVLQLLAEGRTVKEIASKLSLSPKTIETHRNHILRKLKTNSIAELTKYAIREGLTTWEK